jgi:hypothetical protein
MVIDFSNEQRAIAALQILAAVGISVLYTPDVLSPDSPDPADTHGIVYRLEMSAGDAPRARAVVEAAGFWPERGE